MVKNTNGGNKAKHKARKDVNQTHHAKLEDLVATEDQDYAKITAIYGGGKYQVITEDKENNKQKTTRIGICCGRIKRFTRPKLDDIVLISLRSFQDNKCDILHLYSRDELQTLVANNVISHAFIATSQTFGASIVSEESADVVFGKEEDEEDWNTI